MGITPIVVRRAFYYLSLGIGEYYPEHPHFDKVTVEQLYEPTPHPGSESEWSMGIVVSFYKNRRRVRWVDFGCRLTGAGGDSILQKVENTE